MWGSATPTTPTPYVEDVVTSLIHIGSVVTYVRYPKKQKQAGCYGLPVLYVLVSKEKTN